MITISWNNFDKGFWLTAKNMRNLIKISIQVGDNINSIESKQQQMQTELTKAQEDIKTNAHNTNIVATNANIALATAQRVDNTLNDFMRGTNADINDLYQKNRNVWEELTDLDRRVTALGG